MSLEKHNLRSETSVRNEGPFTKETVQIDWSTGIEMTTWWEHLGQLRFYGDIARIELLESIVSKLSGQEVHLTTNNQQNNLILPNLKGKTIVDIGCGQGKLSIPLAHLGAQIFGIDNNPEMIKKARQNKLELPKGDDNIYNRQVYMKHDVCDLKNVLGDGVADAIISAGVAIFISSDKIEAFISEQARILKSGGIMAMSTINYALVNPESPPKKGTSKITDLTELENIEVSHEIDGEPKKYTVQNIEEKYHHSIIPASESQSFNLYLYPNQLFIDLGHKYSLKLMSIEDVPVTQEYLNLSSNWQSEATGYSYNTLFYFQKI